ncbi:MAG: hypothetical protein QME96_18635, partial [Myxococcota bacterium]|nr:hypothetical protein [Myxococcota bacterium]
ASATAAVVDTVTVSATAGADTSTAAIRINVTMGDDDWQGMADLPEALTEAKVVGAGGYLYALGGALLESDGTRTTRVLVDSTYRWDPATNGWDDCAVADLPDTVSLGGACAMNGHIYYVGGLNQLADSTAGTPAFFAPGLLDYDIATDTWTEGVAPTYLVMNPIVACDPAAGRIYVYGGYVDVDRDGEASIPSDDEPDNPDTTVPLFQMYAVATGAWRDDLTPEGEIGLSSAGVVLLDGRIHFAGGQFQQQDDVTGRWQGFITRTTTTYDIAGDSWTDGPWLPDFNGSPVGVAFRGRFCIIGGEGGGETPTVYPDWWCLTDPTWVVQSDPLPATIASFGATVMGDNIYVVGGTPGDGTALATAQRWPTGTLPPAT